MSVADLALKRPYTVVAALILISLLGIGAALRMPVDIFPEIDIPVVAVVWTYNGMSATDIQNRILTLHQRQLASLVDDAAAQVAGAEQFVRLYKNLGGRLAELPGRSRHPTTPACDHCGISPHFEQLEAVA